MQECAVGAVARGSFIDGAAMTKGISNGLTRTAGAVALFFMALSGCTSILDTTALEVGPVVTCTNSAGAYFLPKKTVTVTIQGDDKSGGELRGFGINVGDLLNSIADRDQGYCLDYLGSLLSRDEVGIIRSPEGLLRRVYTRAEDKTVEIAKTLIDTGFLLAGAAGRDLIGGSTGPVAGPFEFDPFDPYEAAKINSTLRQFGYCVFVEGFSFPYGVSPGSWCEQPRLVSVHVAKAPPLIVEELPPLEISRRGVLYRPNISHTLTVLRKADPRGSSDSWKLTMAKQIEVPNRAPVFVAEVNRSLFVDRITDLEFSDGVLTNISVKKPSEAAAFVEIPLAIVSAVVAVPGLIVKLKINDANNQERLIRAQTELISVRRQHKDAIDGLVASHGAGSLAGLPLTPDNRSLADPQTRANAIQNCLSTGKPLDVCERQWADIVR